MPIIAKVALFGFAFLAVAFAVLVIGALVMAAQRSASDL